jgi:alpha-galactosidase/6-phospho-beta-glucosidase family protein
MQQKESIIQQKETQTADLQSKLLRAKHIIENLMKAVREKEEVIARQKGEIDNLRDDKLMEQEEKLLEEVGRGDFTPEKFCRKY